MGWSFKTGSSVHGVDRAKSFKTQYDSCSNLKLTVWALMEALYDTEDNDLPAAMHKTKPHAKTATRVERSVLFVKYQTLLQGC